MKRSRGRAIGKSQGERGVLARLDILTLQDEPSKLCVCSWAAQPRIDDPSFISVLRL